jgi:hypothetical protein
MTEPPESGDQIWRNAQVEQISAIFPQIGYTAPNGREMAERNLVERADGTYIRHPSRRLFVDAFEDDSEADILRMYRGVLCPTLIIRCTESGAPDVLDLELDALEASNRLAVVQRLPLTHLAPAWDALDSVAEAIEEFWRATPITP